MWFKRQSLNNLPLWLPLVSLSVNLARGKEAGPTQREPNFWELHKINSWGFWYKCLQPFPPRWWTAIFMMAEPQAGSGLPSDAPAGRKSWKESNALAMDRAGTPKGLREKLPWAVLEGDVCSRGRLRFSILVISYFFPFLILSEKGRVYFSRKMYL